MTESHDWNPEDGAPPTEEEMAEAKALASILDVAAPQASQAPAKSEPSPALTLLVQSAMRVRATSHQPSAESVAATVKSAVNSAVQTQTTQKRSRTWMRLVAVAAVAIGGITGVRMAGIGSSHTTTSHTVPISRSADDVFRTALSNNPGSTPISMIDDSRIRSYRSNLFARGGRVR